MKRLFFVMAFCLCGFAVMAQTTRTVKGMVVDKYGNPLPGAIVEVYKGAESTTVDADGSYSLEIPILSKYIVARYGGMSPKRKKISGDEITFYLNSSQWFVNAVVSLMVSGDRQVGWNEEISSGTMRYGIMFGQTWNWGWYSKILFGYEHNMDPAITVGFTKRLSSKFHMYAGAGYASVESHDEWNCGDTGYCYRHDAIMLDLGFMIKPTEHFNINIGCSGYQPFNAHKGYDTDPCLDVHLGLGYSF